MAVVSSSPLGWMNDCGWYQWINIAYAGHRMCFLESHILSFAEPVRSLPVAGWDETRHEPVFSQRSFIPDCIHAWSPGTEDERLAIYFRNRQDLEISWLLLFSSLKRRLKANSPTPTIHDIYFAHCFARSEFQQKMENKQQQWETDQLMAMIL